MTDEQVIKFLDWVIERLPPEYDGDTRQRFTPQVSVLEEKQEWIETRKFSRTNPKFYTTKEVLELYKIHQNDNSNRL
jgi:hypothetical protein